MIRRIPDRRAVRACQVAVVLGLAAASACGYRRPSLVHSQATVTLDGEPVPGASVMLVPTRPGRPVMGFADDAGRVAFSTYGSQDGVPAGTYRAVITKLVPTKKAKRKLDRLRSRPAANADEDATEEMVEMQDDDYESLLPAKYASTQTTPIEVTIDHGTRQITLALESEKPRR